MKLIALIILFFSATFSGCASFCPIKEKVSNDQLTIISFPPGADIEIKEGVYAGKAPLNYPVTALKEYGNDLIRISAYLNQEGYCTQHLNLDPKQIPKAVYFDMSQCAEQR